MRDWNLRVILKRIWGGAELDLQVVGGAARADRTRRRARSRRQLWDDRGDVELVYVDARGATSSGSRREAELPPDDRGCGDGRTPTGRAETPYVGLVPYGEDDAAFFFGRDGESEIVAANLARPG